MCQVQGIVQKFLSLCLNNLNMIPGTLGCGENTLLSFQQSRVFVSKIMERAKRV